MNSSANVPATHKVRKGIAAVAHKCGPAYLSPFPVFSLSCGWRIPL